jgi:hypothetical protein
MQDDKYAVDVQMRLFIEELTFNWISKSICVTMISSGRKIDGQLFFSFEWR